MRKYGLFSRFVIIISAFIIYITVFYHEKFDFLGYFGEMEDFGCDTERLGCDMEDMTWWYGAPQM